MASGSTHRRTRELARKKCGNLVHTMRISRNHAKNQRRQEKYAIPGDRRRTLKPRPSELRTGKNSPVREPLPEMRHQQLGPHRLPRKEFNWYLCFAPDPRQGEYRIYYATRRSVNHRAAVAASFLLRSRSAAAGNLLSGQLSNLSITVVMAAHGAGTSTKPNRVIRSVCALVGYVGASVAKDPSCDAIADCAIL
jgi:hypothetical protein